jgi:anti-sigma regulatory factor (Ser/Thr protein kinase)
MRTQNSRVRTRRWPAALGHVREARAFAAGCVDSWDAVVPHDDLLVVTSELVTNAVVHARTPFTVAVAWNGDAVLIQVTDGSETLPEYGARTNAHADHDQGHGGGEFGNPGGRGLMLVDAMTLEWGSTRVIGGKTVWAVMAAESAAAS